MTDASEQPGGPDTDLTIEQMAELEAGLEGALSARLLRLDVVVGALMALGAGALAIFMPDFVISGGIIIARTYETMSPSLIPRLAFGGLAVVAAISTLAALARLRRLEGVPAGDEGERFARAAVICAIVLFYALTVSWLGFILSTMIVAAVTAWFLGMRNPLEFIPGVLIVPLVIRFVFERLLLISLPRSQIEPVGQIEDAVIRFLVSVLL